MPISGDISSSPPFHFHCTRRAAVSGRAPVLGSLVGLSTPYPIVPSRTPTPFITVRRLIRLLQSEDPNRVVILSTSADGAQFSPLAEVAEGAYAPLKGRGVKGYGTVGVSADELDKEDACVYGHTDADIVPNGRSALVLYPFR